MKSQAPPSELEAFLEQVIDKLADGIVGRPRSTRSSTGHASSCARPTATGRCPSSPPPRSSRALPCPPRPAGWGHRAGPFQGDNVHFTCGSGFTGTAAIRAAYPCGARQLQGSVEVTCGEETCSEDALQFVTMSLETVQLLQGEFFQCASPGAPQPPFQPFSHTAGLRLTNRHPSRTIAVNLATIRDSNDPASRTQPCQGAQCDQILGPCFAFLAPSPDPASPPPFATSPQLVYDCEQVEDSPLPPGTNLCNDPPIHSTGRVIVQATFCTPESPARDAFCDAGKVVLQQLAPHASFPARQVNECP